MSDRQEEICNMNLRDCLNNDHFYLGRNILDFLNKKDEENIYTILLNEHKVCQIV